MSGVRWERARTDRYARVPFRLDDALLAGDLTYDQSAVLLHLVVKIGRTRSPEVSVKLRALADALAWEKSEETLRRVLQDLREGGWIAFESKPGQRKPYRIRLVRAAIDGDDDRSNEVELASTSSPPPRHLLTEGPSPEEVTSSPRRSEAPPSPLPERDSVEVSPPRRGSPLEELENRAKQTLPMVGFASSPSAKSADGRDRTSDSEAESPLGTCTESERLDRPGDVAVREGEGREATESLSEPRINRRLG